MNNIKRIISYYLPTMPYYLVYIFQQTDYETARIIKKLYPWPNLKHVKKRGTLEKTNKVKLLLLLSYAIYVIVVFSAALAIVAQQYLSAVILVIFLPIICIFGLLIPVIVANIMLQYRRQKPIYDASEYFASHKAVKIAVLGSYGKTTMKELLVNVMGSHFKVAATPGNQNIPISIARWSKRLKGDEDVLIFEYGEARPGDIAALARLTHPRHAFATGFAPNHLDGFKNKQALMDDFKTITKFIEPKNLYVNKQMSAVFGGANSFIYYSDQSIAGWVVKDVKVALTGLDFKLVKGNKTIVVSSKLLGRHNIGPLSVVAVFAESMGMPIAKIEAILAKTEPYEHRMQPRQLHGAWIIDDTYNGNLEGFKAGLELLNELPAKRKIYVTPGLVEQGAETENVHTEIGEAIAKANPDVVVLMKNSVTEIIQKGLKAQNYTGVLKIEPDPLAFYTNIDQIVANGDIVLMQNDWPDGYQ